MSKISVIILNCKSLNSKLGEVKLLAYTEKPDIICLSETWLKNSQYNPKFINYNCIYKNRDAHAGGVAIIIKKNIKYQELTLKPYNNGILEIQAIKVFTVRNGEIVVVNLYNPNKDLTENELKHYVNQIGNKYVIVGDYNANTPILDSKCKRTNKTGKTLENILDQERICLSNPKNFYTYLDNRTGKLSCLDLCLVSANLAAHTHIQHSKDVGSDHRAIKVEVDIALKKELINTRKKWIITKESLINYRNNIKTRLLVTPCAVEEMAEDIEKRITEAAEENISQTKGVRRNKSTIWWNNECQKAVTDRRRARRKVELHPTNENLEDYKRKTNIAKQVCKKSKQNSWHKYIEDISYDTPIGTVWKKFRSVATSYEPQTYPIEENDQLIVDSKEKANKFAEQFIKNGKIGKHIEINNLPIIKETVGESEEYNVDIEMEELEKALCVKKQTTPGVDNIPYKLLTGLKDEQKQELLETLNMSWGNR